MLFRLQDGGVLELLEGTVCVNGVLSRTVGRLQTDQILMNSIRGRERKIEMRDRRRRALELDEN